MINKGIELAKFHRKIYLKLNNNEFERHLQILLCNQREVVTPILIAKKKC